MTMAISPCVRSTPKNNSYESFMNSERRNFFKGVAGMLAAPFLAKALPPTPSYKPLQMVRGVTRLGAPYLYNAATLEVYENIERIPDLEISLDNETSPGGLGVTDIVQHPLDEWGHTRLGYY
jgi:hypothetical protein